MRQEFLKEKIASVQKTTKDVEKELLGARKTIDLGKEGILQMKDDMKSYSVPNVFSYIQQTGESYDLEHQIAEWQRKESLLRFLSFSQFSEYIYGPWTMVLTMIIRRCGSQIRLW